jgi:Bacteriophage minor capsid protein
MILDEIGAYLQAEGIGIIGQTLFLGSMPQDEPGTGAQDAVLALIEIPSRPPMRTHDLTLLELPRLQVQTRGAPYGYPAARLKAQDAWNALEAVTNQMLSGITYLRIETQRSPYWLRTDDMLRPHLIFDIECARVLP